MDVKPMKWLAIVNPVSGGSNTSKQMEQILFEVKGFVFEHQITEYPGHAEELAEASSDFDGIAVVGGDGTLLEVLKCMDLERQTLAIIPTGTGNSLARDLDFSSISRSIEAIDDKNIVYIDLMRVTFRDEGGFSSQYYSASTIGIGYPANLVEVGNRFFKHLGKFCYPVAATVKSVFNNKFEVQLGYESGNLESKSLTGLLVNNTRHAGNFKTFPGASIDDGQLDVMELNAGFFKQNLHNISLLSKKPFYAAATLYRMKSLVIKLRKPQFLMIDGEIFPDIMNVEVEILPRRLKCYKNGRTAS